jgi:hypothetical protein
MPPELRRFERTFTVEYKEELANYIRNLDGRLMPVTREESLKLAFVLAEQVKIPYRFNKENGMAEKYCYYDPVKWHPPLSL